ncbi:hypothetical protein SOVF_126660 [Spinacia oleracea]|nr:hypothetical protein SOVF_126660 [Spinacia oleracea]
MEEENQSQMLPEEMIAEVFLRLPAKSVGRFRCVSNRWNYLLTQPQFVKSHLNLTKQHPTTEESLILVSHDSMNSYSTQLNNAHHMFDKMTCFATKLTFDDHLFYPSYSLYGSCDGLILKVDYSNRKKLFLINPTTREFKELPSLPYALDPRICHTVYGLGYDSVKDDYRVVVISHYDTHNNEIEPGCNEMFVDVYSVGNGTWKRVDSSPYDHTISDFEAGAFVNGSIHWLARRTVDDSYVIAAFDLREEKFRELPLPSLVDSDKHVVGDFDDEVEEDLVFDKLVSLGGYLCGYPEFLDNYQSINAWIMKKYGVREFWTKIFVSDDPYLSFRPICLYKKKQMVLVMHEGNTDEKLAIYNSEDGTLKDIVVDGIPRGFSVGVSFMETLVSPHCSNEAV